MIVWVAFGRPRNFSISSAFVAAFLVRCGASRGVVIVRGGGAGGRPNFFFSIMIIARGSTTVTRRRGLAGTSELPGLLDAGRFLSPSTRSLLHGDHEPVSYTLFICYSPRLLTADAFGGRSSIRYFHIQQVCFHRFLLGSVSELTCLLTTRRPVEPTKKISSSFLFSIEQGSLTHCWR